MDIEDIADTSEIRDTGFRKGKVVSRSHKRKKAAGDGGEIKADSDFTRGQKIYVRTWGCTHNTSDSEYMAGQVLNFPLK